MGNCVKGGEVQQPVCQRNPNPHQTNTVSDQDKTIIKLKSSRDKLLSQKHALYQNINKARFEAKLFIKRGKKDRALFALKRNKLYDKMMKDIEKQETIIEKTVTDVEGKIQLFEYTNVLKKTNDLIESLETATELEALQHSDEDVGQREVETREFNKLFEEHNVNDSEVNDLFKQFEAEVDNLFWLCSQREEAELQRQAHQKKLKKEQELQMRMTMMLLSSMPTG